MRTNKGKLMAVFAVMVMMLAGSACVLIQPGSEGNSNAAYSKEIYIDVTDDTPNSEFLSALGATGKWTAAKSTNQWNASITIDGANCNATNFTYTTDCGALAFYCDSNETSGTDITLNITLKGTNNILTSKTNKIGMVIDAYNKCNSINTVFKGDGTLNTNGIRAAGDITLTEKCTVNSLCINEISKSGTMAAGVLVAPSLYTLGNYSNKIEVGSGCILNAMASCTGANTVVGACAGSIVVSGGKANFIATETGSNNYGLYSDKPITVTVTGGGAVSTFAINEKSNKSSHAVYCMDAVTLSISESIFYAYGNDSGVYNKKGGLTINETAPTVSSDIGIYGDTYATELTGGSISGDIALSTTGFHNYYYTDYSAHSPISFDNFSDLPTNTQGFQIATHKTVLEIPRTLYNGIDLSFSIGFDKKSYDTTSYTLKAPTIMVTGKDFDYWWANDDLLGSRGTKTIDQSFNFSNSGFYWVVSMWKDLPSYTVTYKDDGTTWKTETTKAGSYTVTSDKPTKLGFTFDYWDNNGSTVQPGETIQVTSDITLEAHWKPMPTHTVTYTSDGKTWKTETVNEGSYKVTTDTPTKTGYMFNGWKYDGKTVQPGETIQVTSDITLEAQWKSVPTHTVTYTSDGKTWKTETVNEGSYKVTTDTPTKSGYDFTGWKYNGTTVQPGDKIVVTSNVTLVAQWAIHEDPQPSGGNDNTALIIVGVVAAVAIIGGAGVFFFIRRP